MKRMIRFLYGQIRVKVDGYSPGRFLNLCRNRGIRLWDVRPSKEGYEFCIRPSDFKKMRPLLKKTGTRIHITDKRGLGPLAFRYRKHRFFLAGIASAFCILFLFSRFIWNVEINGNIEYSDQTLTKYLESLGAGYGTLSGKIQCSEIEKQIRIDYPDIVWVSIRVQGTSLIADIQEASEGKDVQNKEITTGTDLIAQHDGTVASVVTRSGTPCVKEGDQVKKGDVLVSGCLEIYDDTGAVTDYHYCRSDADIYLECTLPYSDSFPAEVQKQTPTGDVRRQLILSAAGRKFLLSVRSADFAYSDRMTCQTQIKIGQNFYLPVMVETVLIREMTAADYTLSRAEAETEAAKRLELYCRKMTEKNFEILEKNVKIKSVRPEVDVSGNLKVLEKVTEQRPTPVRTLEKKEGQE